MHEIAPQGLLSCPLCGEALRQTDGSLRCANRHTFDIARQGYVNLLTRRPDTLYEDAALFEARRRVYAAGFFDPLLAALARFLPGGPLLDAGCGEGSLLHRLAGASGQAIGVDIAKVAVRMAASAYKGPVWCVADVCNLPLPAASIGAVLNILTPANYAAFDRVLGPGGRLLKAIPGPEHLREIRAASGLAPYAHDAAEALALLARRFTLLHTERILHTRACDTALAADLFTMTPMTAHTQRPAALPDAVTCDLTLLIAKKKDDGGASPACQG